MYISSMTLLNFNYRQFTLGRLLLFPIFFGLIVSACDEPSGFPESEIDKGEEINLMSKLESGESIATYKISNLHRYNLIGNSWKEVDLSNLDGGWSTLPHNISVTNGEWWLPYVLLHESGPSPIAITWQCYQIAMKCEDTELYIAAPSTISADSIILGTYKFKILKQTTLGFRIAWETDRSGEGHREMETADYLLTHEGQDAIDMIMRYSSEYDMYVDLLARFREIFGDEMNANTYLYPNITLDDPIINFDELEDILLAPYRD